MLSFPNCKINLGLNIIRKRNDGYHDLQTVFYPVGLKDVLEINKISSSTPGIANIFTSSGITVSGEPEQNLVMKAWKILQKDFPSLPPVSIHLHKNIPMGAGLGGGSADGAFALLLLNQLLELGLTETQLQEYASKLGSDCAFFIINKASWGTGRGEVLETLDLDLSSYSFVLVHPGIHASTSEAFSAIKPRVPGKSILEIISNPIETWRKELVNDFESGIFTTYPELKVIKESLYRSGAIYSSMTGSGSSLYGIFPKSSLPQFNFPSSYRVDPLP